MGGEKDLKTLLKNMQPRHNPGDYVFCVIDDWRTIDLDRIVLLFKEQEGYTIVIKKELADQLELRYAYTAAWITLDIHSSLEAVGLTAAFSKALAEVGISCNAVAAYYHDHIFVDKKDCKAAMETLNKLSEDV
jgi:hypothetical protein